MTKFTISLVATFFMILLFNALCIFASGIFLPFALIVDVVVVLSLSLLLIRFKPKLSDFDDFLFPPIFSLYRDSLIFLYRDESFSSTSPKFYINNIAQSSAFTRITLRGERFVVVKLSGFEGEFDSVKNLLTAIRRNIFHVSYDDGVSLKKIDLIPQYGLTATQKRFQKFLYQENVRLLKLVLKNSDETSIKQLESLHSVFPFLRFLSSDFDTLKENLKKFGFPSETVYSRESALIILNELQNYEEILEYDVKQLEEFADKHEIPLPLYNNKGELLSYISNALIE